MARRRFLAPLRAEVPANRLVHPLFLQLGACQGLIGTPQWPSIDELNDRWHGGVMADRRLRFVEQTDNLLADGLHYEIRIRDCGQIATRPENWHDLFNALAWLRHGAIKAALNRRQADEVRRIGSLQRSRAQDALTQFDEAGCVLLVRDPALQALWDEHDWPGLFWDQRDAWNDGRIEVAVFGHALYEHALLPEMLLSARCLVALMSDETMDIAIAVVAKAIADGAALNDPAELRPLPLSGIPGWHPQTGSRVFYEQAPCFRPRRVDRCYPPPIQLPMS